jgi:hypothetical protein
MINIIPVFGWAVDFIVKASLAVPFWFVWTVCGIGDEYFYWLPSVYRAPSFWNCVGVFIVIPILKTVIVPKLASVSQTNQKDK